MRAPQRTCLGLLSAGLALAITMALPEIAVAQSGGPPWLRIERMDVSPSVVEGYAQVRIHASAVSLRGEFLEDLTGKDAWALLVGKQKKRAPYIAGQFHALEDEIVIGLVIDTSSDFADVLPTIQEQIAAFIDSLPKKRTRVVVLGFDSQVHGTSRARSTSSALADVAKLYAEADPGDKLLLDALGKARSGVARAKPASEEGAHVRRMIVVISDGRDADYPNPANYRKISKRAARDGIPIHTIAFAPDGNRLPLRAMGELSKNSNGTFRFAYTKNGFKGHFAQLTKEILNQYVVTFFVPFEDIQAKRVGLMAEAKGIESTDQIRVAKMTCGEDECADGSYCVNATCVQRSRDAGRGVFGWLLLIGGITMAAIVALAVLGFVISLIQQRRQRAPVMPPESSELPPEQPDVNDPRRVVAQSPYGGPIQQQQQQQHGRMPSTGGHAAAPPTGQQRILPTGGYGAAPRQGQVQPTGAHGAAPSQNPYPQQVAAQPSILILEGAYQGQRMPLHNGFVIGKAPGCHLMLAGDNFASGHHARIDVDAYGQCTVTDQGSTNGTFVNGVRVTQKRLSHGNTIKVGSTTARFLAQ